MNAEILSANRSLHEGSYLLSDLQRLYSYKHQLESVIACSPGNVAVIGVGDSLVYDIFRSSGIEVYGIDIDQRLCPDICCSVLSIPLQRGCFDVTLCCQVLEHVPFESFIPALQEIRRITRERLVLSLPDVRRFFSFRIRLPVLRLVHFQCSLPRLRHRRFPPERTGKMGHHWEIGYRGYDFHTVTSAIKSAGWNLLEYFRVYDLPWHTFFVCSTGGSIRSELEKERFPPSSNSSTEEQGGNPEGALSPVPIAWSH